eukprot:CAMPEP_0118639144 /NCGR_PEP_ID=MMETSP0785-20121206/4068_1 /TAXON_ID=91992 /ORGANISM="Bolidomonas pacifica, Strain CCMP 1866" /LENGTH=275 /DNA_ID=CAMNT_0006530455 /DNA_START=108 /DNA_END=932 /DNA_ORIENTATION=-
MVFGAKIKCDLDEEAIEEIKMNTHFKRHEIIAYRKAFLYHTTRHLPPPETSDSVKDAADGENKEDSTSNDDEKKSESGSTTSNSDDTKEDTYKTSPPSPTKDSEETPSTAPAAAPAKKKSQVVPQAFASTLSFKGPSVPDLASYPMSITRHQFLNIKSVAMNPLKDRIALCFEFEDDLNSTITFEQYMQMAATFNRPGNREQKLKLAFKIQAFTDPKKITKGDLKKYYDLIARNGNIDTNVPKKDRKVVINKIMMECSSDPKRQFLSFEDFQRVI